MITKQNKDEHLERLWYVREKDEYSFEDYRAIMGKSYSDEIVEAFGVGRPYRER